MRNLLLILCLVSSLQKSFSQEVVIQADSFLTNPIFHDLSTRLLWNDNTTPESAFMTEVVYDTYGLGMKAIKLTPEAITKSDYRPADGLKTNTAIDFEFQRNIDRNTDTVTAEFDLLQASVGNTGEAGRMVLTLLHQYPSGGPQWMDVDSVLKVHPFGRPAYNLRIMSKNQSSNGVLSAIMLYGGGRVKQGESEIYSSGSDTWWLPGFITEAGGFSPGTTPNYPVGGATQLRGAGVGSASKWKHFTLQIEPEKLTLWVRNTDQTSDSNQIALTMFIPMLDSTNPINTINRLNNYYSTNITSLPALYNWFEQANALRIFWNGLINASLANFKLRLNGPGLLVKNKTIENKLLKFQLQQSDNQLTILCDDASKLEIYSTAGNKITEAKPNKPLDISMLPKGYYLAKVTTKQGTGVKSWVR